MKAKKEALDYSNCNITFSPDGPPIVDFLPEFLQQLYLDKFDEEVNVTIFQQNEIHTNAS